MQYQIWSKQESLDSCSSDGNITSRYIQGRNLVGEYFVESMSWTLKDFGLGSKREHGEMLGEALEMLAQCSTRPHILQQRIKALALSHVQMGIRPAHLMFFEHSLFQFLHQARMRVPRAGMKSSHHVSSVRQFPSRLASCASLISQCSKPIPAGSHPLPRPSRH